MNLYLHNTLSKTKELFVPINPDMVGIYSCGPTVYSTQHIGNLRAAFVVDLLKNVLKYVGGYNTKHVMNITDVGHLTGDNEWDADHGEDRMEKWARNEWITAWDVAKKFTDIYLADLKELRIDDMDVMPRATDHIPQQINMIQELEAKWYTYIIPWDGIYMDTSKMSEYGVLVGKKHLEGIQSGARVDNDGRRNPTDFALWKFNMTGKKRDMEWESPWWVGFPWWHIECSAMSMEYLGDQIDIHTGGVEHIPVHHTNEIAQAECSHGHQPWVNYRVHYQHLMMNGQKLAKSTGNVAFMSDILAKWYTGQDLRMFYLQTHYRSFQDFTWEWLDSARSTLKSIKSNLTNGSAQFMEEWRSEISIYDYSNNHEIILNTTFGKEEYDKIIHYLLDDLDVAKAMVLLFEITKNIYDWRLGTQFIDQKSQWQDLNHIVYYLDQKILKIGLFEYLKKKFQDIPWYIQELADERMQAKKDKDFIKADKLRDKLIQQWWTIKDNQNWYELEEI